MKANIELARNYVYELTTITELKHVLDIDDLISFTFDVEDYERASSVIEEKLGSPYKESDLPNLYSRSWELGEGRLITLAKIKMPEVSVLLTLNNSGYYLNS